MHSAVLYIGAYTHIVDVYSCYIDPFHLTFYLLPLCLHSLLLASSWRGAVAKHLKQMRLPSTTDGPVCGWGTQAICTYASAFVSCIPSVAVLRGLGST